MSSRKGKLKKLMSRWMSGCKVRCWLMGRIVFCFSLRKFNAFHCTSQSPTFCAHGRPFGLHWALM